MNPIVKLVCCLRIHIRVFWRQGPAYCHLSPACLNSREIRCVDFSILR